MLFVRQDGSGQFWQHLARSDSRPRFPANPADPSQNRQKAPDPSASERVRSSNRRVCSTNGSAHSSNGRTRSTSRSSRLTSGRDLSASRCVRSDNGFAFLADQMPAGSKNRRLFDKKTRPFDERSRPLVERTRLLDECAGAGEQADRLFRGRAGAWDERLRAFGVKAQVSGRWAGMLAKRVRLHAHAGTRHEPCSHFARMDSALWRCRRDPARRPGRDLCHDVEKTNNPA